MGELRPKSKETKGPLCDVHPTSLAHPTLHSLRKDPIVAVLVETLGIQVTENRDFSALFLKYYVLTLCHFTSSHGNQYTDALQG